jgi:hypothetical protein
MKSKYRITVSDPWDFEGPSGENVIVGEIVRILSSICVIFKSDTLLNFDGRSGKLLILKSRYAGQNLAKENGYEGTVGGAFLLTEKYEDFDEKELEDNSKYVLIGRLEKE